MNPFWQSVVVSVFTGGGFAAILGLIQFFVKRHDDKVDKKSGVQAELAAHGKQLNKLTELTEESNEEQKKTQKQITTQGEAIAGLEHDRIVHVGKGYMKSGQISLEDYDDIRRYLYEPYRKLGGNGTAEDVMEKLKEMIGKEEK